MSVEGGISYDLYLWLLELYNHGGPIQRSGTTGGSVPAPLLQEIKRIVPAFTILNTGGGTLYLGYGSTCNFPLAPGAFFTFEMTNPGANRLTIRDNGVTRTTYEVLG